GKRGIVVCQDAPDQEIGKLRNVRAALSARVEEEWRDARLAASCRAHRAVAARCLCFLRDGSGKKLIHPGSVKRRESHRATTEPSTLHGQTSRTPRQATLRTRRGLWPWRMLECFQLKDLDPAVRGD